jgi:hypothetical protein
MSRVSLVAHCLSYVISIAILLLLLLNGYELLKTMLNWGTYIPNFTMWTTCFWPSITMSAAGARLARDRIAFVAGMVGAAIGFLLAPVCYAHVDGTIVDAYLHMMTVNAECSVMGTVLSAAAYLAYTKCRGKPSTPESSKSSVQKVR